MSNKTKGTIIGSLIAVIVIIVSFVVIVATNKDSVDTGHNSMLTKIGATTAGLFDTTVATLADKKKYSMYSTSTQQIEGNHHNLKEGK
jgi:hypothetical protein